jgi:hypothetical protein
MATSSWLATWLDFDYLTEGRGATLQAPLMPGDPPLPARTGAEVAAELGGRKLLHYMTRYNVGRYQSGRSDPCYATLTAYSPEEATRWLVLPSSHIPRTHVLILDPAEIPLIQGPMWVAPLRGIQYILVNGFPAEAIIVPGAPGARWEIEVT